MATIKEVAADIARELREDPSKWSKGNFARDTRGCAVDTRDPTAYTWCLGGHIERRDDVAGYYTYDSPLYETFKETLGSSVSKWNDAAERTVEDVIALCDRIASQG